MNCRPSGGLALGSRYMDFPIPYLSIQRTMTLIIDRKIDADQNVQNPNSSRSLERSFSGHNVIVLYPITRKSDIKFTDIHSLIVLAPITVEEGYQLHITAQKIITCVPSFTFQENDQIEIHQIEGNRNWQDALSNAAGNAPAAASALFEILNRACDSMKDKDMFYFLGKGLQDSDEILQDEEKFCDPISDESDDSSELFYTPPSSPVMPVRTQGQL